MTSLAKYKGHDWVITHYGAPVYGDIVGRCGACGMEVDLQTYLDGAYGFCEQGGYIKCTCGARACGYGNSGSGHAHHCLGRGTEAPDDEPLTIE